MSRGLAIATVALALAGSLTGAIGCAGGGAASPAPAAPSLVSAIWSSEAGGLCVTMTGPVASSTGLMPGSGFELRLSGPSLSRPIFRVPSEQGRACFELARTPAGFQALRPGPVTIDAMVTGELVELGTAQLDRATIDRLTEVALRRGRAETGPGGPGGAARVEVSLEPPTVPAGGSFVVRARATNTGERPIYRLRTQLAPAGDEGLEPIELDFGWLEPGETLELAERRTLPRSLRIDELALMASSSEQHGAAVDSPTSVAVDVDPLPPPALDVQITVMPDRHGRTVREGNEGRLRPGDDLHMVCEIRNFGDSAVRGGVARLRELGDGNASVRVGRAVIGDLPPGGSTRIHFWFVVKAALGSGRVPMLVEITDADLGTVHEQAIVLDIEER
ncbi:MAG: hypothetical protein ACTS22_10200 [Phycisphaerales bacterium]